MRKISIIEHGAPQLMQPNLIAERAHSARAGRIAGKASLDNVFDRRYVGSVVVNESNGRYFEAGAGRTLLVGVRLEARGGESP
jgi:iron complex outermembrane receptor protein